MKVPGCTPTPTLCRNSLLYTQLGVRCVLKFRVRWGSKWGGSYPRTRRIPPRLGGPASAPQSAGGWCSTQTDNVRDASSKAAFQHMAAANTLRLAGMCTVSILCVHRHSSWLYGLGATFPLQIFQMLLI